jgi:hypothetical protein
VGEYLLALCLILQKAAATTSRASPTGIHLTSCCCCPLHAPSITTTRYDKFADHHGLKAETLADCQALCSKSYNDCTFVIFNAANCACFLKYSCESAWGIYMHVPP